MNLFLWSLFICKHEAALDIVSCKLRKHIAKHIEKETPKSKYEKLI